MPSLEFKGKQFIYTHHLSVPFRTLEIDAGKSLPKDGIPSLEDNLIIHGDNLHTLKALLPTYAGKVDCIFIDPPYNTGTEGWCYNDRVNSPLMREWLKNEANPVDKEDLERHDKWLCMMWPRLNLLRDLLAEGGSIWMTLDDNEIHRARTIMDDIFGEDNFITCVIWHKVYSPKNTARHFSEDHDYLLVYAKNSELWEPKLLPRTEEMEARYGNPDNDPRGPWKSSDLTARNSYSKGKYEVIGPTGRTFNSGSRYWRQSYENFLEMDKDNRIWWGVDGKNMPSQKRFLFEVKDGLVPQTIWSYEDAGHTQDAKKELLSIMGYSDDQDVFITPKPTKLIERILKIATTPSSIILDSFAGSGTTAHAVMALNRKDGGNRKFLLAEMEDYADQLTAERVRRVINGYEFRGTQREELLREKITFTSLKKVDSILEKIRDIETTVSGRFDNIQKEIKDGILIVTGEKHITERAKGLSGSFTYCILGEEINIASLLRGESVPSYEALARYVFYTAIGKTLGDLPKLRPDWLIGETDLYTVHLIYQPDREFLRSQDAALNADMVDIIAGGKGKKTTKKALVFAAVKFMGQKELTERNIEFCQLPYAIHRILGD